MQTNTQDFIDFEREYEKAEKEVLVLISDMEGGALKMENAWQCLAHILAYWETETLTLNKGDGQLTWLISEKECGEFGVDWPYYFKTGTIYRLVVRELKDKTVPEGYLPSVANRLMIVKVLEENTESIELAAVLAEYRKPVILVDDQLGTFQLNKDLSLFSGEITWLDQPVTTYLEVDTTQQVTWKKALNVLGKYWAIQHPFDAELKQFAAERLLTLAQTWQEESGDNQLTMSAFTERISLSTLSVTSGGKFKFDFFDDNIFLGHTIRVSGSTRRGITAAEVVG